MNLIIFGPDSTFEWQGYLLLFHCVKETWFYIYFSMSRKSTVPNIFGTNHSIASSELCDRPLLKCSSWFPVLVLLHLKQKLECDFAKLKVPRAVHSCFDLKLASVFAYRYRTQWQNKEIQKKKIQKKKYNYRKGAAWLELASVLAAYCTRQKHLIK